MAKINQKREKRDLLLLQADNEINLKLQAAIKKNL